MVKPWNFTFNIKSRNILPVIELTQGDGNAYRFNINLVDGALPVPLANQTVRLVLKKADGTSVFKDFEIIDAVAGKVSILLTSQAAAILGNVDASIKIYGLNMELLTSTMFNFKVVADLMNESTIVSANEFSVLTEALTKLDGWETSFQGKYDGLEAQYATDLTQVKSSLANKANKNGDTLTNLIATGGLNGAYTRTADGNGSGLFPYNALIILYAVDRESTTHYLFAMGFKTAGVVPALTVISNNTLTLGVSNAGGTQVVLGGAYNVMMTYGISIPI